MPWRRVQVLTFGLSASSRWLSWRRHKPAPLLEGAAIDAYFATVI